MAATAAAAISSSFSTSMQSLKCIRSKNWQCSDPIKITSKSMSQFLSISNPLGIESILIAVASQKCRFRRITAAVAQEEASLTAEVVTQEVRRRRRRLLRWKQRKLRRRKSLVEELRLLQTPSFILGICHIFVTVHSWLELYKIMVAQSLLRYTLAILDFQKENQKT